jgi:hypothetical protein
MHTIAKFDDKTWYVGRMEVLSDGASAMNVMFTSLLLWEALLLCNTLNGGGPPPEPTHSLIRKWGACSG